jgi:hypothetical protein
MREHFKRRMRCGSLRVGRGRKGCGEGQKGDGWSRDGWAIRHVYNLSDGGEEGAAAEPGGGLLRNAA